jgi:hypothetical protein
MDDGTSAEDRPREIEASNGGNVHRPGVLGLVSRLVSRPSGVLS